MFLKEPTPLAGLRGKPLIVVLGSRLELAMGGPTRAEERLKLAESVKDCWLPLSLLQTIRVQKSRCLEDAEILRRKPSEVAGQMVVESSALYQVSRSLEVTEHSGAG